MEIGAVVFIVAFLIIAILVLFSLKKMKHKLIAFFLISLILFAVFSFNAVFQGKDLSVNDFSDIEKIVNLYLSWFSNAVNNLKVITTQAIKMDWKGNTTT